MQFRLALGGFLPDAPAMHRTVDELLGQVKAYLYEKESEVELRLLLSPSYIGGSWPQRLELFGLGINGYCLQGDREKLPDCGHVTQIDSPLRNAVGKAVCNNADLLLMVWNEDVLECGGASWELIQQAYRHRTPCLWISSKTGKIYWPQGAYYEPYSPEKLKSLCRDFRTDGIEPRQPGEKTIPLVKLGMRLRQRYLQKHSAYSPETAVETDHLLEESYPLEKENPAGAALWKEMLREFTRFDKAALGLGQQYQAVMYWRAILPFLATAFLAVGFYTENLLGVFPIPKTALALTAGIGFLIHGFINLYVYLLSRSSTVWQWHQGFVEYRSITEMLRVLLHFLPYGLNLDLRKLCGEHHKIYVTLRRITEKAEPAEQSVDRTSIAQMLAHTQEMLADQISYHRASAQRFRNIVDKLEKWTHLVFGLGFAVVLLRSLLQFALVFVKLEGSLNGVDISSLVPSFANMLALMLPAWASYFTSKAALCNYRYNLENDLRMTDSLQELSHKIDDMGAMDASVPMEAVGSLVEEIADVILIKDTSAWRDQYMETTVKHL